MLAILWNLGAFIVALGILIAIHEYGHFWVARRCGVKVERFSIGFGKTLWRKVGDDGCEYVIAAIPLGGYVKMLDERVEEVPEELKDQAFNRKSVWARSAIVAAGPLANFVFAVVAYYLMLVMGLPSIKPVIAGVQDNTPAAVIQVDQPQQITAVGGREVRNWEEAQMAIIGHIGAPQIQFTVQPLQGGASNQYTLDSRNWKFDPETESPIRSLGLTPYTPTVSTEVAVVMDGGAAANAGLQQGDVLLSVNGDAIESWESFVEIVQRSAGIPLALQIERAGQKLDVSVMPETVTDRQGKVTGRIGLSPVAESWPESMQIVLQYGPLEAIGAALDKTGQMIGLTFSMLGKLVTGDIGLNNLSGPISIAQGAGNSAGYGLVYFLGFLALISVNLGIINLLPLPVLDGGHLLYNLIEMVTGKPVPEQVQEIGFRIGAATLLLVMGFAIFNDIARL
ncbi:sigma E protease regulator RseP [Paraferrimonas sedimenticola]|uniref:Zinc metalloprotease n=1 Tax=Paraferrimonas sedimenticola TaxID=375674 RepID=A0AA37W0X1_9GAMM|nr:sigma E protease regulator RseP [Paraferrimonas sedimenticola]GLP96715.1 zinc metalloprotease [Paraferrimonas sedimenticola]